MTSGKDGKNKLESGKAKERREAAHQSESGQVKGIMVYK